MSCPRCPVFATSGSETAAAEFALLGGDRFSRLSGERSGGKSKKESREKAAQNNQISEKTSLFWKKTLKNLHI